MTRVPEVARPHEDARAVLRRMRTRRYRHLPVLDAGDTLVGMISERDLLPLDGVTEDDDARLVAPRVEELMTRSVKVVHAEDTVHRAVELFLEHRFGAVPVVEPETNALVGIVSPLDLLKAWHDISQRVLGRRVS